MIKSILIDYGIVIGLSLLIWMGFRLILYLKHKKTNSELWGTIFEGITHNAVPQEPLKEPQIYIEKKARRDGKDKDPLKGISPIENKSDCL